MADILDQKVINFTTNRVRKLADRITSLRYMLEAFQADYAACGITSSVNAAGASLNVGDGYLTNGNQPITGTNVLEFSAMIGKLLTNINTDLVTGVGKSAASICDAAQIQGSPR